MTTPIAVDAQEISTLARGSILNVLTEDDAARASEYLAQVTKYRKGVEAKYKELKKPFDEGIKNLKAEFDKLLDPLTQAESETRQALLTYNKRIADNLEAQRRVQQQQYAQAVQAAAEAGTPVEDVPVPLPPAAVPGKGFATQFGSVTSRRVPDFEVVDETQIPLWVMHKGQRVDLWTLNTANIRKIRLAAGDSESTIPGVKFTYREGLQVR